MISKEEYQARRVKLAQQLQANSIALIAAAPEQIRNGDAHYRFRQDSNFYYLTGFNEPEAVLLIANSNNTVICTLFNRVRDPAMEQWTGARLGQEGAILQLDMDNAFPIQDLTQKLPLLLAGKSQVYYILDNHKELEKQIIDSMVVLKKQVRRGIQAPQALCDLEPILSEMRLYKSEAEIELLRRASRISVDAHFRAMRKCSKLHYEYELEAELLFELNRQGCRNVAYDSIVGSGANACVLHYTANNQPLNSGNLVLIDAGGEYENYAADITHTFPVNGQFSPEQKKIYELVLKAHDEAIALIKPGLPWYHIQEKIVRIITEGLCELNILQGDVDKLISNEAYKAFYMHQSGHWLGLDVHDAGSYKINNAWRPLEANMVLTVEPGIYIAPDAPVDAHWQGIGVRIEDDVLVTKTGHEVLTAALPRSVADIEALMSA